MKKQRLDKLLSNSGYGSRKEVKALIKSGMVTIDGIRTKDSSTLLNPSLSIISVAGTILEYKEFHYIMLNKPGGVISATFDNASETVLDLLPAEYTHLNLFPVGRLDKDTEGLLLLTNDGKLAHKLLSPKHHIPKTYYARIDGFVDHDDVNAFKTGISLDPDFTTLPAELVILKQDITSEIRVTIYEGKFHQVKRMFEAVNKKVLYLKRISMGSLRLDEKLKPGNIRELTQDEIDNLKSKEK